MFGVISVVAFREIMQGHLEAVGIEQERRNALDFFSAHFLADQLTLSQSKGSRLSPFHWRLSVNYVILVGVAPKTIYYIDPTS